MGKMEWRDRAEQIDGEPEKSWNIEPERMKWDQNKEAEWNNQTNSKQSNRWENLNRLMGEGRKSATMEQRMPQQTKISMIEQ